MTANTDLALDHRQPDQVPSALKDAIDGMVRRPLDAGMVAQGCGDAAVARIDDALLVSKDGAAFVTGGFPKVAGAPVVARQLRPRLDIAVSETPALMPVLVWPLEGGRFRARFGGVEADGDHVVDAIYAAHTLYKEFAPSTHRG